MKYLLDTNVLLALAWPNHSFHEAAHRWWKKSPKRWATCAITQLGFIRLSANPAFTRDAVTPYEAAELLDRLIALAQHEYWERLSHLEARQFRDIVGHKQVNNTYLVKLALLHRGRLATFDSGIRVIAAPQSLELIPS